MRGSPLLRALAVFILLLCLAPGIWKLTHAESRPVGIAPEAALIASEQEIALDLEFTAVPSKVAILYLGKEVWTKSVPDPAEEISLKLAWPKEGGELQFKVEWAEDSALAAMRVKLADPEHGQIERSLWGKGSKTGVLKFP